MRRERLTADEAISRYKQASIRRQFPAQFIRSTLKEIEEAARTGQKPGKIALKLLFDRRFDKR
jgi:hypothetical protein